MLAQSIVHLYSVSDGLLQDSACTYAFNMPFQVRISNETKVASITVARMLLGTMFVVYVGDVRLEVVGTLERPAALVAANFGVLRFGMSAFMSMIESKTTEVCKRVCSPMRRPQGMRFVVSVVRA